MVPAERGDNRGGSKVTLRRSDLCALVIALSVAGYPLVAGLATLLGLPNALFSIGMRAVVAGISLLLVVFACSRLRQPPAFAIAVVGLLLLYGVRLVEQTLFRPQSLGEATEYGIIWYVGATMLPVLAVMLTPFFEWRRLTTLLFGVLTFAGLLAAMQGTLTAESDGILVQTGRLAFLTLNPISVGNVGVALALLGIWELFGNGVGSRKLRVISLGVILLGLYLVFAAGSRGPVMSLTLALMVMILSLRGRARLKFVTLGSLMLLGATFYLFNSEIAEQTRILERTMSLVSDFESDGANTARRDLFQTSLQQIGEHPLLGSSIENSVFRWSPHNIILEFALATGLLVGTFFVVLLILLTLKTARILRARHPIGGLALIFIASVVGAQFSGNVYQNSALWVTAMALAVTAVRQGVGQVRRPAIQLSSVSLEPSASSARLR